MDKYNEQSNDDFLLENNLFNINDYESLEQAEAFVFSIRATQIEQGMFEFSSFNVEDVKNLHKHLFQDIYPFAGEFRKVQLMKGNTRFCQAQFIDSSAVELFHLLNKELEWDSLEVVAKRLAFFKSELNMLHPFREGNGRTIRIFLRAFALTKGVEWHYANMDQEVYLQAMIQSVTNTDLLENIFLQTIEFSHC